LLLFLLLRIRIRCDCCGALLCGITDDDPGLPINTLGSYKGTWLSMSVPVVRLRPRDLHTTIIPAHIRNSKSKLQTDCTKRSARDFVLNFYRTITLSLLNTLYVCDNIYIIYIMYTASVWIRLHIYLYMCSVHCVYIPQPGDFIHSGRVPYIYNKDEDEAGGKSNFFAPIKTLSPALFGGAHPLCQHYHMILLPWIYDVYILVGDGDVVYI